MSENSVKPCFFCQKTDVAIKEELLDINFEKGNTIKIIPYCRQCGFTGNVRTIHDCALEVKNELAFKAWNKQIENICSDSDDEVTLVTFKVQGDTYTIKGKYSLESGFPEFMDVCAYKLTDGNAVKFEPQTSRWSGVKFDVYDMVYDYMFCAIQGNKETYTTIYLVGDLQKYIEPYQSAVVEVNGYIFPEKIRSHDMCDEYELSLATDQFLYYVHYDSFFMLSTDTHELVSDNYFAEIGCLDSVENIKTDKETLLWGNLSDFEP